MKHFDHNWPLRCCRYVSLSINKNEYELTFLFRIQINQQYTIWPFITQTHQQTTNHVVLHAIGAYHHHDDDLHIIRKHINTINITCICNEAWCSNVCSGCHNKLRLSGWPVCDMYPDSKVHGPTWGPSGADRTQVGPMLVP